MAEEKSNAFQAIWGVVVAVGVGWYFLGGGLEKQAAKDLQGIHNQVAADSVKQYEIAKRNGSAMDVCVQAGFVTAAYLQAKDESNYRIWKITEDADCTRAGIGR